MVIDNLTNKFPTRKKHERDLSHQCTEISRPGWSNPPQVSTSCSSASTVETFSEQQSRFVHHRLRFSRQRCWQSFNIFQYLCELQLQQLVTRMATPNGQTYLDDMLDWNEKYVDDAELAEQSEIANFYAGCNVLITGGSGFMGKLLVEKLLRTCSKIQKLYLIMRAKKGKSPEERYKEHFEDVVYNRLKREQPNFASKVIMIEGQMEELGMGLSPENRELLKDSHVVFHGAATVRFDEKLRLAVNINIRGTKEILLFSREMPNLKAFVHIGTAFSQCVTKFIDETFYAPPIDADKLLTLVDILDDKQLELLTPELVGNWPNTYAFTKAVGEDIVRRYSKGLPACIVRPSIMIATDTEPIAAWINNLYGPTGVVVGAGIGLLRTLHCEKNNIADIIPADYVINNIVAAAWDVAQTQKLDPNKLPVSPSDTPDPREDPPIYNSVSSCQNPITWGEFMKWNEIFGVVVPSALVLWYYSFCLNKRLWMHNLYVVLFHLIPAAIVDTLAWLTGRKPMLWSAYKKIHKFSGVISYFSTQQWKFRNDTVMRLWDKLSPVDRKLFNFNVTGLNWKDYFFYHIRGLRLFIIKDPMETLPRGRARYFKLKIAHYTLLNLAYLLMAWCAFIFLRFVFSTLW